MRKTQFRFGLLSKKEDWELLSARIEEALLAIQDVLRVSLESTGHIRDLVIETQFEDSNDAKRIHRTIMKCLLEIADVSIVKAESNLSDIFG